jgi:hypothetical protein
VSTAHVTSIPAVRDFKVATLKFQDEANSALELLQVEIQRAIAWIEQDRPAYWTGEVRRAFDKVAATRVALNTCQMRTVAGRRPSCIEEKQAYDRARQRLAHCQEQVERVKRWGVKIHHECDEFRGRLASLRRTLDNGIPRTTALLERTLTALEGYAEMAAPTDPDADAAPDGSGERA